MHKVLSTIMIAGLSLSMVACSSTKFKLESSAFKNQSNIPYKYTYCQPDGKGRIKAGGDISPPLKWVNAPRDTMSYVLLTTDPYIPNSPYFNSPGHVLTKDTPRVTQYHWTLVNIPKTITALPEGAGSKGLVPGGKKPGMTPYGLAGINVYNAVFKVPAMAKILGLVKTDRSWQGTYGQYDGGCPPWNDKVIHDYVFTIYALNIAKLDLPASGNFSGEDVLKAIKGHVLATATLKGKVITNPDLLK